MFTKEEFPDRNIIIKFRSLIVSLFSDMWRIGIRGLGLWCLMPLASIYFSYIVEISFISGGNWNTRRKPPICRKSLTNFITQCFTECTSSRPGFELTTLVVIGIDCIGSCKSNYHTTATTTITLNIKVVCILSISHRCNYPLSHIE